MEYVRFGELYSIPSSNGVSRPSAVRGKGYKMINMGELFANDIINDMPMERVELSQKEKEKFLVQEKDLLFARQSLVAEGAGKCSIIKQLVEETTFESHLIRVRLNEKLCNPWFYYYLFQLSYNPVKSIVNQCAQAGIRGKELIKIKVPLPSIGTQNKIADILSTYDDLIENNNRRIALLEKAAQELYKEWFVRFRFPGYETVKLVDSRLGKIPFNFNIIKMSEAFDYYIGGGWGNDEYSTEFSEKAYVIRGTDFPHIQKGNLSTCPLRYHKKSNYIARELKENDIIIEVSGGTAEQPVGRTIIVTNDVIERFDTKVICASFCKLIRLNHDIISPYFFYYWMQFLYDTRIIDRFQLQSTGIINFKFEYFLRKGDIMLPPKALMDEFELKVKSFHNQISVLAKQNENLTKQRDLLLPRLMSGKLEV